MTDIHEGHSALGDVAARTLANATKTVPQLRLITPRWFVHMLQWVPVEAGIYRVNKVKNPNQITVDCSQKEEEREFDTTFVDYEEWGREYYLSAVNTVVDINTRVSDLYSSPHNQIHEQVRLAIEIVKEPGPNFRSPPGNNTHSSPAPAFQLQPGDVVTFRVTFPPGAGTVMTPGVTE